MKLKKHQYVKAPNFCLKVKCYGAFGNGLGQLSPSRRDGDVSPVGGIIE